MHLAQAASNCSCNVLKGWAQDMHLVNSDHPRLASYRTAALFDPPLKRCLNLSENSSKAWFTFRTPETEDRRINASSTNWGWRAVWGWQAPRWRSASTCPAPEGWRGAVAAPRRGRCRDGPVKRNLSSEPEPRGGGEAHAGTVGSSGHRYPSQRMAASIPEARGGTSWAQTR